MKQPFLLDKCRFYLDKIFKSLLLLPFSKIKNEQRNLTQRLEKDVFGKSHGGSV